MIFTILAGIILLTGITSMACEKQKARLSLLNDLLLSLAAFFAFLPSLPALAITGFMLLTLFHFLYSRANQRKRVQVFAVKNKRSLAKTISVCLGLSFIFVVYTLAKGGEAHLAVIDIKVEEEANILVLLFLLGASLKGAKRWKK